jgi:chloramphenicol O-acetyltransferase
MRVDDFYESPEVNHREFIVENEWPFIVRYLHSLSQCCKRMNARAFAGRIGTYENSNRPYFYFTRRMKSFEVPNYQLGNSHDPSVQTRPSLLGAQCIR